MSVDSVLDYGYKFTCTFCASVRTAFIGAFIAFMAFGENVGRARAASELSRMGYHEEAKNVMLGKDPR